MTVTAILQRILDSIVALVMICLSLVVQAFFFLFLGWGLLGIAEMIGYKAKGDTVFYILAGAAFVLFNGLAAVIYSKQRKANVELGKTASMFFYIPRAIDTIVYGSQRVSRSEGMSDINPCGTDEQKTAR